MNCEDLNDNERLAYELGRAELLGDLQRAYSERDILKEALTKLEKAFAVATTTLKQFGHYHFVEEALAQIAALRGEK